MKAQNRKLRVSALGISLAVASAFAGAQQADQTLEKIEVTGSAIRRVESEGALPVQVITAETIAKSGATSATDLIQSLAVMTGGNFQQASNSVNGGGGGETTAAIHGLDQKYTLVLLNGHRFAPWGSDGSVNLESIPLDAIDRIEVLTDGASALYGSDAIAGVVNFITKKNKTDGAIFANVSSPQQSGGKKYSLGISKGFGDFDTDGWNIMGTYSHDFQDAIMASQRSFSAQGGRIPFSYGGNNYLFYQTSINSLPGNIVATYYTDANGNPTTSPVLIPGGGGAWYQGAVAYNPYFDAHGNCGSNPAVFVSGGLCRTNYSALVEDMPASRRDSFYLQGRLKLNNETTLYAEAVYSHYDMNAQYAPPAQPMGLSNSPTSPLAPIWNTYVANYAAASGLTANGLTSDGGASLYYRAFDAGGRTDDWVTNARHLVLGAEGTFKGWDYNANFTYSANTQEDNLAGGYLDFNQFIGLIAAGKYDPLIPVAGQAAAISSSVLSGNFTTSHVMQNVLSVHASKDMYEMPGGKSNLALGADYTMLKYDQNNSYLASYAAANFAQTSDYAVGGGASYLPFDAARNNYGVFAEYLMPVAKKTEVTASVRYDSYGAVKNSDGFSAPDANGNITPIGEVTQGKSTSAATFKISFRMQPIDKLLVRGSFGTGFKAPSISQIASPVQFYGNTSGSYPCPVVTGAAGCAPYPAPGVYQYDLITGGNSSTGGNALKPETAHQWTVGFRYEPIKQLSGGIDLWDIKMNRQIMPVPENLAFANPGQFASLFINPYHDPFGVTTVGLEQFPVNIGQSEYEGFDWEINGRQNTAWGLLTADLNATHMLKQQYQFVPGGAWNTDLGVFGPDNNVVFRNTAHLAISLKTGDFTNTLTGNYKSGYHDESYTASGAVVFHLNPNGTKGAAVNFPGLQVPSYTLWDWQTRYDFSKATKFTFGITNLFNTSPPLSLKTVSGNQVGYDGRYTDPTGRALTARIDYKF